MKWNSISLAGSLNKLKQLLNHHPKTIIGIDLGTHSIKVVEIDVSSDKPFLKRVGLEDYHSVTNPDNLFLDNTVVQKLEHLLTTSGILAKEAVIAISSNKIFVREITFPAMTEAELCEAVKWDSENYVPYHPGSYYYDFSVLPSSNTLESKILFVAAPQDAINRVVSISKEVGLKLLAVDIEPLALHRTLNTYNNCAILDIGAAVSQIILFENGVPYVTRSIPIAGQSFTSEIMQSLDLDFPEAENLKKRQKGLLQQPDLQEGLTDLNHKLALIATDLIRELSRTLDYYQIQNKSTVIDKLILTGGGSKLDNLDMYISKQLGLPVINNDVLEGLNIPESFSETYLQELAPQFAVAIGLALRGGK
ncbi:Cell division protein FtsA [bioreactor metagenome]|uniref:Cell division protein FtsA n=1 Tax=bioreactor metagenome TaxID=1076179 RepID=A0A644T0J5_9ZZZZ|nr:type IV pilus assembly protein PilM [Negativicutes bacterium]